MLVPEISLTPQTIERFSAAIRQGRRPAQPSLRRRAASLLAKHRLGRGAGHRRACARRSLLRPGDWVSSSSTKNMKAPSSRRQLPRYHARDVAVKRAQMEGIPVLLGSATPSLESWRNAQRGRYTLLSMPSRVGGRPMPNVEIIDLRHEKTAMGCLSEPLRQAMIERTRKGRSGHPALEPPRVSYVRPLPALRRRGQVPRMRCGDDVP